MFLTFISYIRDFIKFDSSSAYESTFDKRDRKISLMNNVFNQIKDFVISK